LTASNRLMIDGFRTLERLTMAIELITRAEFTALNPAKNPAVGQIATETAWFADSEKNIIGAILLDHHDNDLNYVVLGRDEEGQFRWIAGDSSFDSREKAEDELTAAMSKIEASGETIFPQ